MEDSCGNTEWTFGEFVAAVYAAWGELRAPGLVQLAVDAHLVEFLGGQRVVISRKKSPAIARSLPPESPWPRNLTLLESRGNIPDWMLSASVISDITAWPILSER